MGSYSLKSLEKRMLKRNDCLRSKIRSKYIKG